MVGQAQARGSQVSAGSRQKTCENLEISCPVALNGVH